MFEMSINHKDKFLVCGTEFLYDPRLSLASKGLLATLLTLSDRNEFSFHELSSFNYEDKEIYQKAWKELNERGYIVAPEGEFTTMNKVIIRDYCE